MRWLDMLSRLVGPIVATVQAIAGDDWDPDEAEAAIKALVRNPPRPVDLDRERLERIAQGTTGSD